MEGISVRERMDGGKTTSTGRVSRSGREDRVDIAGMDLSPLEAWDIVSDCYSRV